MVFIQARESKGIEYLYLDKSVRIGRTVKKISRFIGRKDEVTQKDIKKEEEKLNLEIDNSIIDMRLDHAKKNFDIKSPLDIEEIKKIEEMNLKYQKIRKKLDKKDWEDVKKRFVANFVFESNALEGNSLTLKNFSEIVFEEKILNSADLREVYDAKNSYGVFSKLFVYKRDISEELMIDIHDDIMENIDDRKGYKKIPNIILGRNVKLTDPNKVKQEIVKLIEWYKNNEDKLHALELAFIFHHKFEKIHPFSDGNGRVGRMLLNYILVKKGYFPVIIRKNNRERYIKALEAGDRGKYITLMRFAIERAKDTYRKFFEVYYRYI